MQRLSYLTREVRIWDAFIPSHWKQQYQFENADSAAIVPPDPWTTTFLTAAYAAQMIFYNHVLAFCKAIRRHELAFVVPGYARLGGLWDDSEDRIFCLLRKICCAVSVTLGSLDEKETFQPLRCAKFANSHTLLWPMWTVVNFPFASIFHRELCHQSHWKGDGS